MAKSQEVTRINSLSPIIASGKNALNFLSYQTNFASCHQYFRYIRQSLIPCSNFQEKKRHNYAKLLFFKSQMSLLRFLITK